MRINFNKKRSGDSSYELPGLRESGLSANESRKIRKMKRKKAEKAKRIKKQLDSDRSEEQEKKPALKTAEELAGELSIQAGISSGLSLPSDLNEGSGYKNLKEDTELKVPRHVSIPLLLVVMTILCFGLVMLFSASMTDAFDSYNNSAYFVIRQILFTLFSVFIMYILTRIDPKNWNHKSLALIVFIVVSFLLLLTIIPGIGVEVNGQRRWLPLFILPGMNFQPTELAKLAIVYLGAVYFSGLRKKRAKGELTASTPLKQTFKDFLYDFGIPIAAFLFWTLLISMESHWSATLIMALILLVVFLGAGIRLRSWMVLLGLMMGLVLFFGSIYLAFRPQIDRAIAENPRTAHLIQRFNIFTNDPNADRNDTYQSQQGMIAVGSGGLTGEGLGRGRQKFNWLPEIHNDYVFSNVAEELGFIGASSVVILYLIFLLIGLRIAMSVRSLYMQILALGFSFYIVIQAFLSIGINIGVLPPTGVSLPLFSYGGTSNIFFLIGIGLLLSVSKYGPRQEKIKIHPELGAGKVKNFDIDMKSRIKADE